MGKNWGGIIRAFVVALVVAYAGSGASGQASGEAPGFQAFNQGDYAGAAELLAASAGAVPGDLGLQVSTAVAYLQARQYSQALTHLERAASLAPSAQVIQRLLQATRLDAASNSTRSAGLGRALPEASPGVSVGIVIPGNTDLSIEILLSSAKKHPTSAPLASLLGDTYQLDGDRERAIRWYRRALGLAPDWSRPKLGLGLVLLESDPAQSVTLLEAVAKAEPDNPQVNLWLGDAYQKTGRLDEALQVYRVAEASPATRADAQVRIGAHFMRQNNMERAAQQFRSANTFDPSNVAAATAQAKTYSIQGLGAEANTAVQKVDSMVRAAPAAQRALALFAAGEVYYRMGDLPQAILNIKNAIALKPDMQESYAVMARVYQRQGALEAQNSLYERRIEEKPDDKMALRFLAEGYGLTREQEKQLSVYTRLVTLDAPNAWMWLTRSGEVYWQTASPDAAYGSWIAAVRTGYPSRTRQVADSILQLTQKQGDPPLSAVEYTLGRLADEPLELPAHHLLFGIHSALGNRQKALEAISQVIRLDPANPALYGQRSVLYRLLNRAELAEADQKTQMRLLREPPAPPLAP